MSDLDMMRNPDSWPHWPFLPMKKSRPGDWPLLGYLFAGTENLYQGSFFNPKEDDPIILTGFANILANGWVID